MHQFSLYRLANIDADQMANPMKRAALFLGFIKGPNVKDWVKRWTNWTIAEFNTGRVPTDEFYWTEIACGFQNAFQDTGARECTEDTVGYTTWHSSLAKWTHSLLNSSHWLKKPCIPEA